MKLITSESETLKQDIKEIKEINEKKLIEQATQLSTLQQENTKLKDEYSSFTSSAQSQIDNLKSENTNSKSAIEELATKSAKLKLSVEEKDKEITELNKKCEEFSVEIFESDEKIRRRKT